jgi:hypothetical protein
MTHDGAGRVELSVKGDEDELRIPTQPRRHYRLACENLKLRTELWMQAEPFRVAPQEINFICAGCGDLGVARRSLFILHGADDSAFSVFEED